jgi:hypothetical protein
MIEIEGSAFTVVIEFCKALRERALEAGHANRADANKLRGAQSGRAMELMNQALISLADRLRVSRRGRLLCLLRLAVKAHERYPFTVDRRLLGKLNAKITLRWPRWYTDCAGPSEHCKHVKVHKDAGHSDGENPCHPLLQFIRNLLVLGVESRRRIRFSGCLVRAV